MSRLEHREHGVMVEVLDYDKLAAACLEWAISPPSFHENALLRRLDGGAAVVVSSEGVGSTKITIGQVYLDTQHFEWQSLPLSMVEDCRTGQTIDLADHIRVFGDRLDANHYSWVDWAKQETR